MHRDGASAQGDNRREYPGTTGQFSAGETLRSEERPTKPAVIVKPGAVQRVSESLFVCGVYRVLYRSETPSSSTYIFSSLICTIGSISV
jgi:hypothetical protein